MNQSEQKRWTAGGCAGAAVVLILSACLVALVVGGTVKVITGWFG